MAMAEAYTRKLNKKNIEDILPLTPVQEGMLFHYLKNPAGDYYLEQIILEIFGEIDFRDFEKAWNFVISSNEMLRTVFYWEKMKAPVQVILKRHRLKPVITQEFPGDINEAFDLRNVPFGVTLYKIGQNKYEMFVRNHHILYDGWSNGIILKEFFDAYDRLCERRPLIPPVKTKFKEFIKWSSRQDVYKQKIFWQGYLKGYEPGGGILIKRKRKDEVKSKGTANYTIRFGGEVEKRLEDFVKRGKITAASLLYGAWGILLQGYNHCKDVVFGTTVSGRPAGVNGIEDMVGVFINTLPLRVKTYGSEGIRDFLSGIHHAVQERDAYTRTPLVNIKEFAGIDKREELFDSVVVIENYPLYPQFPLKKGGLLVRLKSMVERTNYDLTVVISLYDDIEATFIYPEGLFDEDPIVKLAGHFKTVVRGIVNRLHSAGEKVTAVEMISEEEKKEVLYRFNDTEKDYPKDKTIHRLLEDQVEQTPDSIAVVEARPLHQKGKKTVSITYRELNDKSGGRACLLREKGVGPGTIVGITADPSLNMVEGIFGILKAGGAYLPIDPNYPEERKQYILKDSNTKILLKGKNSFISVSPVAEKRPAVPLSRSLAYVLYTSGSTGKPKGVMVEHGSVVNLLLALQEEYPLTGEDTYLLKTSYVFDVSVTELFGWFLGGGKLAVLGKGGEKDPRAILDTIQCNGVTHINFVPSMFNAFVGALTSRDIPKLSGLKYIFLAGEELLPGLVDKFRRLNLTVPVLLENIYGPTEGTVYSARYPLSQWDGSGSIPIGKPLPNTRLFILDRDNHLQPIGVVGELCIGGAGVARGYLNRPELTNKQFPTAHFTPMPYIYRTGDLARWLPEGNIEFLGRMDYQVKIRGFRIELGEIENRLLGCSGVKEAAVVTGTDETGDMFLCAYVVFHEFPLQASLEISRLKERLGQLLPDYMVPASIVPLEEMPLTASGKVDRGTLPGPAIIPGREPGYIAPRDELEQKLTEIWSEVLWGSNLQHPPIGIDDHFIELGGHSLKAIRLTAQVHKTFDIEVPLATLFQLSTVRELSRHIRQAKKRPGTGYFPVEPVEEREYYAVSPAQKRLYILQHMEPAGKGYNVPAVLALEGSVEKERLEKTLQKLIIRHESFRTSFAMVNGKPVQRIHQDVEFGMEYFSMESGQRAEIIDHFVRPFDLSQAPLFRGELIRQEEGQYIFIVDMHHIITDGASVQLMVKQFTELYEGKELPGLRLRYRDFSQWQNRRLESQTGALTVQQNYWLDQFRGEIPVLGLPIDYARPLKRDFEGETVGFCLGTGESRALREIASKQGASLFMVLLALFNIMLAKVSGREDIVTAVGIEGRNRNELEEIMGMFVNTLALRNYPCKNKTFKEFLEELKRRTLEAFENREYPFESLVEKLSGSIPREGSRNPLFDVMFQFNEREIPGIEIKELKLKPCEYTGKVSKFDLTLWAFETVSKDNYSLLFKFEYSTRLFKPETIQRFVGYFKRIASAAAANPDQRLYEIRRISDEEREKILEELNRWTAEGIPGKGPGGRIFQDILFKNLKKFKDKIAVEYGNYALTYGELDRRSHHSAGRIKSKGTQRGTPIGVLIEDRMAFIINIIGILKAGCIFVPLDSSYPRNRLEVMRRSVGTAFIICDSPQGEGAVELETGNANPWQEEIYIYFTSGTTGVPKAILGRSSGLLHFIDWEIDTFGIDDAFRFSQLSAPGFDAFLRDVFTPLCSGGVICIPGDREVILNAERLLHWLERSRVNLVSCVPGVFRVLTSNALTPDHLPFLKAILFSGERISASHLAGWYDTFAGRIKLVNLWGTSETTLAKTCHFIEPVDLKRERIPVGKPIRGAAVLVLDENMELCEPLVTGELYIRTPFRSFGYYHDPNLNSEKFIRNPFGSHPDDLIHKTGDLGRVLADGAIDLLGRNDRQVKMRGIRIELEEIESVLQGHPLVKEAVVIKKELSSHNELLCAYFVGNEGEELSSGTDIKGYLGEMLPDYMVPAQILRLEKIPRTATGKIDYEALAPVDGEKPGYTAPVTGIEKKLAQIWADILGITTGEVGIRDHFFQLGGNSLNVMRLISRIHRELDVKIPLAMIFNNPTIKKQAQIITNEKKEIHTPIEPVEKKEYYALSSAQNRLYILQQMDIEAMSYNMPMKMKIEGDIDKERIVTCFRRLIKRQESFRTSFVMIGHLPVQRIHQEVEFEIELQITDHFLRPFDLSKAPLLRVGLIQEGNPGNKYILMVDMHHIISDGISLAVIVKELMALYEGKELSPLPIQYKDFSQWQNSRLESTQLREQKKYWLNRFKGKITELNLPTDYPRPETRRFEGEKIFFKIHKELAGSIQRLVRETETTLFIFLLAAYTLLLSKYSEQEDVTAGSPITGRTHDDLQHIVGMFVNMLAIRNYPGEEKTFVQFLEEVKENALKAYENQDYQFEELINRLNLGGKLDRNPLFDTAFSLEDKGIYQMETGSLKLIPCKFEREISQFDLILKGTEDKKNDGIDMVFYYSTALFKRATAEKMKDHYLEILQQVVENKHARLKEIVISHHLSIAGSGLEKEEVEFGF